MPPNDVAVDVAVPLEPPNAALPPVDPLPPLALTPPKSPEHPNNKIQMEGSTTMDVRIKRFSRRQWVKLGANGWRIRGFNQS
jgi:hypothetical protein